MMFLFFLCSLCNLFATTFRAAMDRSVPEGGKAATSEQLQPIYEIKNEVGQQKMVLDAIAKHMQVKASCCKLPVTVEQD